MSQLQVHAAGTDLVLPLKLCPHASELHVWAAGRADVVHDVNVDVIQHHDAAVGIGRGLIHYVAKDGARLCGGHLDVGPAQNKSS